MVLRKVNVEPKCGSKLVPLISLSGGNIRKEILYVFPLLKIACNANGSKCASSQRWKQINPIKRWPSVTRSKRVVPMFGTRSMAHEYMPRMAKRFALDRVVNSGIME